jgi:hypothetical protein
MPWKLLVGTTPISCCSSTRNQYRPKRANDKVVQRIIRHAKPHVTKERYIKAFDPAVLAAMKSMEASLDMLNDCSATVQQVN